MKGQGKILGKGGVALGLMMLGTLGALALIDTQKVTVESIEGRRTVRYADIGSKGSVYLTRQLSDRDCVKGKTWGYDSSKIWVDGGCRAEFEIYRPDDWRGTRRETFTLESIDGRRDTKYVDTRGGVRLVKRLSEAECRKGRSWDYDRNRVWVDDGCRAVFEVGRIPEGDEIRDGYEDDRWRYVLVESLGRERVYRRVDTGRAVMKFRQLSDENCVYEKTWGYGRDYIWVDRGCRALFRIRKSGTE